MATIGFRTWMRTLMATSSSTSTIGRVTGTTTIAFSLSATHLFPPRFISGWFSNHILPWISFFHPPSILPVSSNRGIRMLYCLWSMIFCSQVIWSKNLTRSFFPLAWVTIDSFSNLSYAKQARKMNSRRCKNSLSIFSPIVARSGILRFEKYLCHIWYACFVFVKTSGACAGGGQLQLILCGVIFINHV